MITAHIRLVHIVFSYRGSAFAPLTLTLSRPAKRGDFRFCHVKNLVVQVLPPNTLLASFVFASTILGDSVSDTTPWLVIFSVQAKMAEGGELRQRRRLNPGNSRASNLLETRCAFNLHALSISITFTLAFI
jgi:hypothetical protein